MKRKLAVWCLVLLCAGSALAAPGDGAPFEALLTGAGEQGYYRFIGSMTADEDSVYAMISGSETGVYRWAQGMPAPVLLCALPGNDSEAVLMNRTDDASLAARAQAVDYIVGDEQGRLWGINMTAGRAGLLDADGVAWQDVTLDVTGMWVDEGEYSYTKHLGKPFIRDGVLYGLRDNYSAMGYEEGFSLVAFDLSTGAQTARDLPGAREMTPYTPGKALVRTAVYGDDADGWSVTAGLSEVDLATGAMTPLPHGLPASDHELGGLAYDPASDTVYYVYESQIMASQGGAPFTCVAYISLEYISAQAEAAVLSGGFYAIRCNDVVLRNLDPQYKPERVLRVSAGWADMTFLRFNEDHPDVPVLLVQEVYGPEAISTAITSGQQIADIFTLSYNYGFRRLANRGYAADLSGSQALSATLERMYPQIAAALSDETGHIMGYPRSVGWGTWVVDRTLWRALDMGELPTTYAEFFALMQRFEDELADQHPDISFYTHWGKQDLVTRAVVDYVNQYESEEAAITFSTPVLRDLLAQIDALPISTPDWENMTREDMDEMDRLANRRTLFSPYGDELFSIGLYGSSETDIDYGEPDMQRLQPLVFEAGQTPRVRANLEVYFVNPSSPNLDLALRYLEYVADSEALEAALVRYALYPDMNDPLPDPNYDLDRTNMAAMREKTLRALETAQPDTRREMEESVAFYDAWLADEENNRWLIDAQGIASYRALAPYIFLPRNSIFNSYEEGSANEQLYAIINRYCEGQLGLDAFLRELDNKMRMMFLEGQ